MKLRLREHELLFTCMFTAILLIGFLTKISAMPPAQLRLTCEMAFTDHQTKFNLFRNLILPVIIPGMFIFLAYLFFHLFAVPKLANRKKWPWLLLAVSASILIVSIAFMMGAYYKEQWRYNYHGFSFFIKKGFSLHEQLDSTGILLAVISGFLLYSVYVAIREFSIWLLEKKDRNTVYRVLIANTITAFLVIYIIVAIMAAVFHLVHDGQLIIWYFAFGIPLFLMFLVNMYWLFPAKGTHGFFSVYFLSRLLPVSILCSLLSLLSPIRNESFFVLVQFWIFQLLVLTPISWLIFQQRKDKILQLQGVEKALKKSTATIDFLRSQINPHFLFNTLNTLYGKALQENAEGTSEGIQRLADMMRFMLYDNMLDFIDIQKEISYLRNYIAFQKLRIGESADMIVETNINTETCHHQIAPMLLIGFVENAFKHGIHSDRKSWIRVTLSCTTNRIDFQVNNSMHPQDAGNPEKESGGIGNRNVSDRLNLIYPGKHRLRVTANGDEYVINLVILK